MTHLKEIEYVVLFVIAILQIYFFLVTRKTIFEFSNIFKKKEDESFTMDENSLDKIKEYSKIVAHINQSAIRESSYDLIEVRRITEEHIYRQEDAINRSITIPLYMGLMGTILGIIFGLFAYGQSSVTVQMPIDEIINAVKIAMAVSFLGLLLTVVNQTRTFSNAKANLEMGKEEFYKYLKMKFRTFENEFAPVVMDMKNGLEKFNSEFTKNLDNMSLTLKTAETFSKWDFASLEKAINKFKNVEIYLEKIKNLLDKITKHESTINSVRTLQETTDSLNNNVALFAEATSKITDNIVEMTTKIADSVAGNEKVLRELFEYFNSEKFAETQNKMIEESEKITKAIVENLSKQKNYIESRVEETQKNTKNILEDTQNELTKTSESLKISVEYFVKSASGRFEELDNQIIKTNNEIATAFGKLAKDLDLKGITKEDMLNTAVIGQMENVSKAITESFGEIQKSMDQWKNKMVESIKEDLKKEIANKEPQTEETLTQIEKLTNALEYQQLLLLQIRKNTEPRSLWKIFKDFIGIKRQEIFEAIDNIK